MCGIHHRAPRCSFHFRRRCRGQWLLYVPGLKLKIQQETNEEFSTSLWAYKDGKGPGESFNFPLSCWFGFPNRVPDSNSVQHDMTTPVSLTVYKIIIYWTPKTHWATFFRIHMSLKQLNQSRNTGFKFQTNDLATGNYVVKCIKPSLQLSLQLSFKPCLKRDSRDSMQFVHANGKVYVLV